MNLVNCLPGCHLSPRQTVTDHASRLADIGEQRRVRRTQRDRRRLEGGEKLALLDEQGY